MSRRIFTTLMWYVIVIVAGLAVGEFVHLLAYGH
jgi:hypothetical protein